MDVQKALHLHIEEEKKKPKHLGLEYMIFEKHDGWFGYLDFPACVIHSRKLREIPSLVDLSNLIRSKRPDVRGRLIFEIMIEGLEIDSFHELNGILNRKREQAEGAYLRVHDFIPDFLNNTLPAGIRYLFAKELVDNMRLPEVKMSPLICATSDMDVARGVCEKLWAENKEGIILKQIDALYHAGKRNYTLMKIKEELTLDLKVHNIYEGEGKYEGTLGGLVLVDKNHVLHKVSGMSDEQRDTWWEKPSEIIGKIVEIKAMKKLPNGALREARFKAVRYDKIDTDD